MKARFFLGRDIREWYDLWYIIRRNVFLLTNGIIALVVILLIVFGDVEEGIFLGIVLCINVTLGLGQDIRAWFALSRLQLLTAPRVARVLADGTEESVLTESLEKGDHLKLKTGDAVPCDGTLLEATSLELSEGLLTGESNSFSRQTGERILAGSIITAGSGLFLTDTVFSESRIARMTEGIKSYSMTESPIQRAVNQVIQYSGYLLILIIVFVVFRGFWMNESQLVVIKNIGALASTIVPQGLAFALTLLFAYGAAHLYRRDVLLQEMNATEKLGRIKNLCMDKTGTLTENKPAVEEMITVPGVSEGVVKTLMAQYVIGSGDTSQTFVALREYVGEAVIPEIVATRSFSSSRSYSVLEIKRAENNDVLVVGAPDVLLTRNDNQRERLWLEGLAKENGEKGKRLICLARVHAEHLPEDISTVKISFLAVFVLSSRLRPGIPEAIQFFQDRGVHIRIISGDHPETVRFVAKQAGVKHCDQLITGKEMQEWSEADFVERAHNYTIFARTFPEQKEKLIEALKKNGFTAMVGDGANDALAIKKADLGIAMFEGAPATRKLASAVLLKNSFTALPGGVRLAESIISNAEIFASIFFGAAATGLFLFIGISFLGYPFPFTPLNITLINYFIVGFPGILVSYWTIHETSETPIPVASDFLKRIIPFTVWSSLLQSIFLLLVFSLSPDTMKESASNLWVMAATIVTGYIYFLFAPAIYRGGLLLSQRRDMFFLTLVEIIFFMLMFNIPVLLRFFEVIGTFSRFSVLIVPLFCLAVYGVFQFGVTFIISRFRSRSLKK